MSEVIQFAAVTFTAVLFVVDPFAAVPIFLALPADAPPAKRRATAARAALATFITLALFALAGGVIFKLLGISLGAFQIAGGIMLLLMSVDMMRATPSRTRSTAEEQAESAQKEDVAIVPMSIPMLAGPGAIATVIVLMKRADWAPIETSIVLGSVALVCLIAYLVLRGAASAGRFLSRTTLHVLERIMGVLLAAVSIEFMIGGLRDVFPVLR